MPSKMLKGIDPAVCTITLRSLPLVMRGMISPSTLSVSENIYTSAVVTTSSSLSVAAPPAKVARAEAEAHVRLYICTMSCPAFIKDVAKWVATLPAPIITIFIIVQS